MYIIAIGWIFVTLLMALTETNFVAGVLTFFFYGLAPLALFVWLFGTPQRLRNKRAAESVRDEAVDQVVRPDNGTDAEQDQRDLSERRP